MRLRKNIEYGKSFEQLKKSLEDAEKRLEGDDPYKYPYSYGMLSGAIRGHLILCTEDGWDFDSQKKDAPELDKMAAENILHNPSNIHP